MDQGLIELIEGITAFHSAIRGAQYRSNTKRNEALLPLITHAITLLTQDSGIPIKKIDSAVKSLLPLWKFLKHKSMHPSVSRSYSMLLFQLSSHKDEKVGDLCYWNGGRALSKAILQQTTNEERNADVRESVYLALYNMGISDDVGCHMIREGFVWQYSPNHANDLQEQSQVIAQLSRFLKVEPIRMYQWRKKFMTAATFYLNNKCPSAGLEIVRNVARAEVRHVSSTGTATKMVPALLNTIMQLYNRYTCTQIRNDVLETLAAVSLVSTAACVNLCNAKLLQHIDEVFFQVTPVPPNTHQLFVMLRSLIRMGKDAKKTGLVDKEPIITQILKSTILQTTISVANTRVDPGYHVDIHWMFFTLLCNINKFDIKYMMALPGAKSVLQHTSCFAMTREPDLRQEFLSHLSLFPCVSEQVRRHKITMDALGSTMSIKLVNYILLFLC